MFTNLPARHRQGVVTFFCVLTVAWVGAKSIDYVTPLRPGPDAGTYAAAGMMVADGRVFYREILFGAAPLISVIDGLALSLGDGTFNAIRSIEKVSAAVGAVLAFLIVVQVTGRAGLGTILALLFTFYASSNHLLQEGNVTEEYAVIFAMAGILAALKQHSDASTTWILLSGVFFGIAVLGKEPFLFSALPWLLFVALAPRDGWGPGARRAAVFVAGLAAVAAVFIAYLLIFDAFMFRMDRLGMSLGYVALAREQMSLFEKHAGVLSALTAAVFLHSRVVFVLFLLGICAAACSLFRPRILGFARAVALSACVALVCEYFGASTSGRTYGHYFLQVLPSFLLLTTCGAAFLVRGIEALGGRPLRWSTVAVAALLFMDWPHVRAFVRQLEQPYVRAALGDVSTFVLAHRAPGDSLWSPSMFNSRVYPETGLISASKSIFYDPIVFPDSLLSSHAEKIEQLLQELREKSPAWVVLGTENADIEAEGILAWVCSNYVRLPVSDVSHGSVAYLYASHDRAATLGSARTVDPVCAGERTSSSFQHYQRREWVESIDAALDALRLDPRSKEAYNHICSAYIQLARYDAAIEACDEALALDPTFQLASDNRRWAQSEQARTRASAGEQVRKSQ